VADTKLSALTELAAAPAADDEVYIRDVSEAAADESKRITLANLLNEDNIGGNDLFRILKERAITHYEPTLTFANEIVAGSGATGIGAAIDLHTGATANSTAARYVYLNGMLVGATFGGVDFSIPFAFTFNLGGGGDDSECVARVQFKQANTIGALAAAGIGLRIDNFAAYGESYGTGGIGAVNLSTNIRDWSGHSVKILHYPATPKIEWYIDESLVGTQSTSNLIPQAAVYAQMYIMTSVVNGATGTVDCWHQPCDFWLFSG